MQSTSTRRLRLGLVLVLLLSCDLAVAVAWGPLRERRENTRLKEKLLHERQRLRALRELEGELLHERLRLRALHDSVDILNAQPRRPAPAWPQTFTT